MYASEASELAVTIDEESARDRLSLNVIPDCDYDYEDGTDTVIDETWFVSIEQGRNYWRVYSDEDWQELREKLGHGPSSPTIE